MYLEGIEPRTSVIIEVVVTAVVVIIIISNRSEDSKVKGNQYCDL